MSNLPDAERDACDVLQALAGLAALLARPLPGEPGGFDRQDGDRHQDVRRDGDSRRGDWRDGDLRGSDSRGRDPRDGERHGGDWRHGDQRDGDRRERERRDGERRESRRRDDEARRVMLSLAQDGGAAAQRVVGYLRALRGAGDGEAAAVPPRLGPWRNWVPPRGNLLGDVRETQRIGEVPHTRRADPGE